MKFDRLLWAIAVVILAMAVLPAILPSLVLGAVVITACVIAVRVVWWWTGRW